MFQNMVANDNIILVVREVDIGHIKMQISDWRIDVSGRVIKVF